MKTILLLDCNYLCHRAFYNFHKLQHGDVNTGVTFGFLKDIIDLQDRFHPDAFCFCFDSKYSHREKVFPEYKQKRRLRYQNEADREFKVIRDRQILELRRKHLPNLGYKNIFVQKGYEADDIIASLCMVESYKRIIVSADRDLFQLLSRNTSMYFPQSHTLYRLEDFEKEFSISPDQWATVKAIAGCSTDDVPGVDGVGEKTAAKFVKGTLQESSALYKRIRDNATICVRNLPLVKLPLPGLPKFKIHAPEELKKGSWRHLASKLGMWSIHDKEPRQVHGGFGVAK